MKGQGRSVAALLLALPAGIAALLLASSPPTFKSWIAHLASLELSLLIAGAAVLALLLTAGLSAPGAAIARLVAVPALVVGLIPALVVVPLYRDHRAPFSMSAYLPGRRAEPPSRRDVILDPARPDLAADIDLPPGPGPHPFVVVVHSGAWRSGDKGDARHVSRALARAGHVVVDVRYRLAPANRFPAPIADVKCLLGRLRERAAEFALDPGRGALLGRSAGGEIALVAAYSAGDPRLPPACAVDDPPVFAVVSLYGPTDLTWGYVNIVRPDVVRGPSALELYLGGPPSAVPDAYRLASPIAWVDGPLPRTLLIHGTGDRLVSVENARRLAQALRDRGHPVEVLEIPLAEHGFDAHAGGIADQLAQHAILRYLAGDAGGSSTR
ncbi:MAG TPA: alpha/beta hydrolase [Vicinamibacteria bacterium]